jgi:tetratricopeptide (TPR) repeat protein
LEKAGRQAQAQAELLSTTAALPEDDAASKKQVGRMLIDYGLPKSAENLFRGVAQRNPHDAGALDGLGDAAFANGEYATARDAYRRSLAIDPVDDAIAKRADLCDRILALDPDLPGLGPAARYERTLRLLTGVMDEVVRCGAGGGDEKAKMQQAQATVTRKTKPRSYGDAADAARTLALQLWAARPQSCAGDDALMRVMAKLAP